MATPENTNENDAEALDGDVLGEQPGDEGLPGVNAFTDDPHMLNAEDPSLTDDGEVVEDSALTRAWREQPDFGEAPEPGADVDDTGLRLDEPQPGVDESVPDLVDVEPEAVADGFEVDDASAEEAALHVEEP